MNPDTTNEIVGFVITVLIGLLLVCVLVPLDRFLLQPSGSTSISTKKTVRTAVDDNDDDGLLNDDANIKSSGVADCGNEPKERWKSAVNCHGANKKIENDATVQPTPLGTDSESNGEKDTTRNTTVITKRLNISKINKGIVDNEIDGTQNIGISSKSWNCRVKDDAIIQYTKNNKNDTVISTSEENAKINYSNEYDTSVNATSNNESLIRKKSNNSDSIMQNTNNYSQISSSVSTVIKKRKESNNNNNNISTTATSNNNDGSINDGNTWRCACENGFLPPGLLKSFGGMEAMVRMGSGQCYHKPS